jgi:hypothetical protein
MKLLLTILCLQGMLGFVPSFAIAHSCQMEAKPDSVILLFPYNNGLAFNTKDTLYLSVNKNSLPDSLVIVFDKDTLRVRMADTIHLPLSKKAVPDSTIIHFRKNSIKVALLDTIRISRNKWKDKKPVIIMMKKDTLSGSPDTTLYLKRGTKKGVYRTPVQDKLEFRGKAYTDFIGVNVDQPNGLFQTNVYFSYARPHLTRNFILLYNIVLADLTLSKIEERNRELPVRYNSALDTGYFNKTDLYQFAFIRAITKINVFELYWPDAFSFYVDFTGSFHRTAIRDTMKLSDAGSVTSLAFGWNCKLITKEDKHSKLSAEFSFTHLWPRLFSDFYQQTAQPQYIAHTGTIQHLMVHEVTKKEKIFTGIDIFDLTLSHRGEKNSLQFLRISVAGNYFSPKEVSRNVFCQLQLGVELSIDELMANNKSKDKKENPEESAEKEK